MRLLLRFLLSIVFVSATHIAVAQGNPVHLTLERDGGAVHPGEATKIRIKAVIDAPYHIYSAVQLPDPAPLATTVAADDESEKGLLSIAGKPGESAPKPKFDKGFNKDVGIHEGTATFEAALAISSSAPVGTLSGTVSVRSPWLLYTSYAADDLTRGDFDWSSSPQKNERVIQDIISSISR